MNAAAIALAPAAMSPLSLSKSNCASSPMVGRAGAVAVLPPEMALRLIAADGEAVAVDGRSSSDPTAART
jgi:hypothetical protein